MIIGTVDCSAADNINLDLCEENDVDGVPAINVYKDGVKVGYLVYLPKNTVFPLTFF